MIEELYESCFAGPVDSAAVPASLIRDFCLKQPLHIVFRKNKGWIFDYENSVLYTLTQLAALFLYAIMQGRTYAETVAAISRYYGPPICRVDSDLQGLLTKLYQLKLITLGKEARE